MIQTMLNTVEIDIALVSGLILLGVATVVSTIGLTKIGNENTKFAMKRSDGHYLISVASYISLIAFVPLTVYQVVWENAPSSIERPIGSK